MKLQRLVIAIALLALPTLLPSPATADGIDQQLAQILKKAHFTGRIESTLQHRLGRRLNPRLATLGRDIFFDTITGLHGDNNCSGCHSPTNGFGDSQSIAIGVDNNGVVGDGRKGARNQRRTPMIINTAFYPKLMWNGRFSAPSGDPFDNSQGFTFPQPEGRKLFPAHDPLIPILLIAQAHIPPTEITEAAGFSGTKGTIGPQFDQFDNGKGSPVPAPDRSGFRNEPIREAVLLRFNSSPAYRERFARIFTDIENGEPITFIHIARAIAEFELTMTFADAPLDHFARGDHDAMTESQKRGAVLFFGKAGCVNCHAVGGQSNEMFSDFKAHVIGIPQIAPVFGVHRGNVQFDGENTDEDFGLEQVSGNPADRYKFRTAPLRNLALSPAFFHNGSYTQLADAVRHHLDVLSYANEYNSADAGVAVDLTHVLGPIQPVLDRLDPLMMHVIHLTEVEVRDLVAFVGEGLLDERAKPEHLCGLIPAKVPSGKPVLKFQSCESLE